MPSTLLNDRIRDQLRGALDALPGDVELQLVVHGATPDDDLHQSQQVVREVAEELVAAGPDHVRLRVADLDGGDRPHGVGDRLSSLDGVPVLQFAEPDVAPRIAYMGVPGGYEFSAVVDTVRRLGEGEHGIKNANVARLMELDRPVEVMVFVTPSCPYCPAAASLAFRLAMVSPQIRAVAVEAMEFPELSTRHHVSGVPRIVVNRADAFVGAIPEDAFVGEVLRLAEAHPM